MKPPPLRYLRAESVDQALELLDEYGHDAKVLAGGQSLISLLNLRLARPTVLVDIGRLTDLRIVGREEDRLSIGALVTHHMIELSHSDPHYAGYEVLPETAHLIGHLPIRVRGTFGGSVAHGDPAAEWPLLCLTLDANVVLANSEGSRSIPIDQFYLGFLTTCMAENELLLRVDFGRPPMGAALSEFSRRQGDFAIVAVAAALDWDEGGRCTRVRLAIGGVGSVPVRVMGAEQILLGETIAKSSIDAVADAASSEVSPSSDIHASDRYRRHLVRVLTRKALHAARWRAAA